MTELLQLAAIIFLTVFPFCVIVVAAISAGGEVKVGGFVKVKWGNK